MDGGWAGAVATGCYDGTARLWTPGGKLMCSLSGHDGAVTAVSLLPPAVGGGGGAGGCVVVAGGHDATVRTWDVAVAKGKAEPGECRVFTGHEGAVNAVAASPGGEVFASASHDCTARIWRRDGGAVDGGQAAVKKGKRLKKSEAGVAGVGPGDPDKVEAGSYTRPLFSSTRDVFGH